MKPRAWGWWLAYGATVSVLYYLFPEQHILLWGLLGYPAAALTAAGAWRNRPSIRLPWLLLAAGQLTFAAGDTTYNLLAAAAPEEVSVPSPPDLFYLSTYLLLAAGLLLMIRARADTRDASDGTIDYGGDGDGGPGSPGDSASSAGSAAPPAGRPAAAIIEASADVAGRDGMVPSLLDALAVTTGLGLLSWVFLIVPYLRNPALSLAEEATAVAFPLGDILLLAVFAGFWSLGGRRGLAFHLIGVAMVGTLAADTIYAVELLRETWAPGGPVDLGWIVFYLALTAAALHPSMRSVTEPIPTPEARLTLPRLFLLAAASLIAPVVLVVQWLRGAPIEVPVIAGAWVILFMVALVRLYLLATQVRTQAERRRLLDQVVRATESERVRIAGDLHDGPVQQLTALALTAYRARRKLAKQEQQAADDLLASLEGSLEQEVQVLRRLMTELRPPALERDGLEAALREQVQTFEATTGVEAVVDVHLGARRLSPDLETLVYRVVQEGLTNIAKHARATKVTVSLHCDERFLRLSVTDDGVGFDPEKAEERMREGHLGLVGMRDRVALAGGRLVVHSAPGKGTRLEATIPWRHGAIVG